MSVAWVLCKEGILRRDCKTLSSKEYQAMVYNITHGCSKGSEDTEQTRARGLLHIQAYKQLLAKVQGYFLGKQIKRAPKPKASLRTMKVFFGLTSMEAKGLRVGVYSQGQRVASQHPVMEPG